MGFFNWISNFLGKSSTAEKTVDMLEEVEIRTRDKKGRFIADDPNTPENEAFKKVKKRKSKVSSISKKKTKKK